MRVPRVAIVGRPNVGKSTLFNRITGSRRAIVDRLAGSTRDRHFGLARWGGKEFEVVDTGGLFEMPETRLHKQVAAQVHMAMQEADVICWVVDATEGLVPEDLALSRRLRSLSGRVLLAVNKVDHPGRVADAFEFHRLGLDLSFELSAEHGLGVAELLDAIVGRLPAVSEIENPGEIRIAIVGRPNVGKSSLLNCIVGETRMVVTEEAGTTRDAVDTLFEEGGRTYRFVDTAGIRRKGKLAHRADELGVLYAERAIERAHLCFLVLDAAEGVTTEDAGIGGKIERAGRGAILVFNKWDLVTDRGEQARREEALERLRHLDFCPMAFVSAITGRGVSGLFSLVERVREAQVRRIPTPDLNRFLQSAVGRNPPRSRDGKEVRLLYMTQHGMAPPRFVVFGNRVRGLDPTYPRYLARRLREQFGFEGTPVRVALRQRKSERPRRPRVAKKP